MPVTITHPSFDDHAAQWRRIDDALSGRDAVIRGGVEYLPMLEGQINKPEAYSAYQKRANFYGASARTVEALIGAIFRKDPTHEVSSQLEYRLDNFDGRGNTVYTFSQKATKQVLSKGRYGLLVDMPTTPDLMNSTSLIPWFAGYSAASIRSWRTRDFNGIPKLDQVILEEFIQKPAPDGFGFIWVPRYRVLELDVAGLYQVRIFNQTGPGDTDYGQIDTIQPKPTGQRIDYIPFIFINSGDLMPDITKSPILDLVDVNLAMWRASADLENGRHYTAHCTPWITGLDENDSRKWRVGGDSVWQLPEGCTVGMLEYTGQGLGSLENGVRERREEMAFLGARLLRDQKKAAETAEAQEIQQSGENATLASIARTVSDGFTKALQMAEDWISSRKEAKFELNQDFVSRRMDPAELTALFSVMQGGGMPLDDFLWNLKQGEMLDPSRTIEEARELLDLDAQRTAELYPDPALINAEANAAAKAAAAEDPKKPAATAGKATQGNRDPGKPVAKPKARTT